MAAGEEFIHRATQPNQKQQQQNKNKSDAMQRTNKSRAVEISIL